MKFACQDKNGLTNGFCTNDTLISVDVFNPHESYNCDTCWRQEQGVRGISRAELEQKYNELWKKIGLS